MQNNNTNIIISTDSNPESKSSTDTHDEHNEWILSLHYEYNYKCSKISDSKEIASFYNKWCSDMNPPLIKRTNAFHPL